MRLGALQIGNPCARLAAVHEFAGGTEPQEFDRASNFRSLGDFCRDTGTGLVAPDLTTVKRSAVAGDDVHDRLHPAMVSSDGEAVQSNDR